MELKNQLRRYKLVLGKEIKKKIEIIMTFIVSEKKCPNGLLLVITDQDLIGKKFEEGKLYLDLTTEFYQGKEMNKEEVKELLTNARDIHLTGKESVALGVESEIVSSERILWIQGTPHAEVVVG